MVELTHYKNARDAATVTTYYIIFTVLVWVLLIINLNLADDSMPLLIVPLVI